MAGELWLTQTRVGKEATFGTAVTPTRKLYLKQPTLNDEGKAMYHDFATATRDNVRAATTPFKLPSAAFSLPASSDELVELLLCTIQGAVSPSTPSGGTLARDWVYTPSATLDSMTMQWDDGARPWQSAGMRGNGFEVAGDVDGDNLATFDMLATDLIQTALSGSVTDRVPSFMRGWEARMYIGAFGTDPATLTTTPAFLKKWSVKVANNAQRKYLANNTQVAQAIIMGMLGVDVTLTVEASASAALTEFTNWRAATKRIMRLEFGNNEQIESSPVNEVQTLTEGTAITAGTFTLSFGGFTTTPIGTPWSAAMIQAALEALPSIGVGNITATGGPLDTALVTITFVNQLGGFNVAQLTSNQAALTGTFTHATTTPGVGYKRLIWLDIPGAWEGFTLGGEDQGTRTYEATFKYVYDTTNAYGFRTTLRTGKSAAF